MTSHRGRNEIPGLLPLLRVGIVAGLTDGQLLECFATRAGDASELAFAALVERHGPMVFRACRAVLRDEHDARDAFQATFLILARRGGSLWVRDSVGPWLHRVARHAAVRARQDAERRRRVEQGAIPSADRASGLDDDIVAIVHEEVDRLPERYRVPVVLCELEGRSHEEAARHLGCAIGTIKSRLSRARERLRNRLTRRGLAPEGSFASPTLASLPVGLAKATTRSVVGLGAGSVPSKIAEFVIRSMFLTHLRTAAMKAIVGITIGAGLLLVGTGLPARQEPQAKPAPAPVSERVAADPPQLAWRRVDRYEPPDFARFFPDDVEGGLALDKLWTDEAKDKRPAVEVLPIVRKGLRRTTSDSEVILKWVGSQFIWGAPSQDPDAIEILYHATDHRGPWTRYGESPSIYFGMMRVEPTPAILHALVDWCMHVENSMDWHWAGWTGKGRRPEMLSYLKPYLDSPDEATRELAVVVGKFLVNAPDSGDAYAARASKLVRAKWGHKLPEVKKDLLSGGSRERLEALKLTQNESLYRIADESFIDALRACAEDKDPKIRRELATALFPLAMDAGRPGEGRVVDLLLRLLKDENPEVRYDAMYQGLTPLPPTDQDRVIRGLLDMALADHRQLSVTQRIAWALNQERDQATRLLDEELKGKDPTRVEATRAIYKEITGRTPPGGDKPTPETKAAYVKALRDLHDHLGQVYPSFGIKGIKWDEVGKELLPRAASLETEEQFGLLVLEMVARLEDSHAYVHEGTATPPRPSLPEWDPGLASLIDDRGRPVLYAVPPLTPAWKLGVRPGMTIESVNGVPAAQAMDRWMEQYRKYIGSSSERNLKYEAARWFHRQAVKGAKVSLVLEDLEGKKKTVDLVADWRGWWIPRLPVPKPAVEDGGADVQWFRREDGVGYIHIRRIRQGMEVSLDQALTALKDVKGLILDVRGNSGGGFDTGTAFQNFDLSGKLHKPLYTGPIALLIDERCISAGEGWSSWFVANKRARLFGSTTAGASARKETYELSNGMYKVEVPVKAYTGFLDRPIERRGLEPDSEVRCTAKDLSEGRDTVAEAAADWLKQAAPK